MAPRDRITDTHDGPDDWFDDTAADDVSVPVPASPPAVTPGRRLSVLTDSDHSTDDPGDSWFHDSSEPEAGDPVGPYGSFDTRTSMLRARDPHTAPSPPARSWWRRHRSAVAVTAALAVLGGGALGAGLLLTGVADDAPSPAAMALDEIVTTTAAPTTTATVPAAAGAAAADVTWCTGQADGDPVTDSSADPGAAAIWRFEKAFYFDRDGAAARAAGAPDAVMASAQRLQQGIDQLEADVEFCVLADPVDTGIYNVTVVERGPGIDGRMSRQRITTAEQQDGQTLISAIVPR